MKLKAISLNRWPLGELLMAGMAAAQGNILSMPDLLINSEYGRDELCQQKPGQLFLVGGHMGGGDFCVTCRVPSTYQFWAAP